MRKLYLYLFACVAVCVVVGTSDADNHPRLVADAEEYVIPPDSSVVATVTAVGFPADANISFNYAVRSIGSVTIKEEFNYDDKYKYALTVSGTDQVTMTVFATDGEITTEITLRFIQPTADFDGDGTVGFADFLAFAGQFGARRGDGRYQAKYDLSSNGNIDFADFLLFVNSYGQSVPTSPQPQPPSGSSSPDLIVESPSVSDTTITSGQSFTLQATVRNQGTGQSASTTLRYYQSSNSTISASDTQVGTDSVSGLSASGTSAESISLRAPASTGTYYYGACVASVTGESNTNNNCSDAVRVTVSSGGGARATVEIPDANLRGEIEWHLGKARGAPITRADMAHLTRINAYSDDISDLTGLEYATNLTWLNLSGNQLSDITVLSGLTNLTELYLGGNDYISDITALSGLTNLTELDLSWNNISDITALSGLTNLTQLDLGDNQISDITALAGLTNLTRLDLWDNQISDITALAGLTNLTELNLSNNQISDIAALSGLTNLTSLRLGINQLSDSDITALSGLTNLTGLDLGGNQISDIAALSGLTNLTELDLRWNNISDIATLSGLTNLTQLGLYNNQISDITALSGLTNLTDLWLSFNQLSDIAALSGLTNLTELNLSNNQISDIAVLLRLTNLTDLYLRNNPLSDTSINTHIPALRARGVTVTF